MPQARKFFTKAISRMEREGRVKVLGICGGMQGILYFNDIALDTVSSMIGKIKAEKYKSAYPFLSNDHYINQTKKFYSCQAKLNKIFISQRSRIGNLMIKAEKKYGIKYDRNREEDLIVEVPFAHGNAVSSFDRINLDKLKSSDFNVVGLSEDRIIYVVENKKNGDILIQGHPELIANTNHCGKSFADRNAIFGRLLFYNLLQNQLKSKLPNHLLTFAE
jgi:gamma-glutamyl-gamma-aminobutyrate hydrolase PuuD